MIATEQLINTLWQQDTKTLEEKLLAILSKQSYIKGKVTLTSGKESNYYVDTKLTSLDPEGGAMLSILFLRLIGEGVEAVGGLSTGADPLASGVSQISYLLGRNIVAFYVRKEPKKHGISKWIEGPVKKGSKVVVLEDVVTTGGSSLKAVEKITEFGCKVDKILAIVDRNEGGKEVFKQKGIKFECLFDIKDLIERAESLR